MKLYSTLLRSLIPFLALMICSTANAADTCQARYGRAELINGTSAAAGALGVAGGAVGGLKAVGESFLYWPNWLSPWAVAGSGAALPELGAPSSMNFRGDEYRIVELMKDSQTQSGQELQNFFNRAQQLGVTASHSALISELIQQNQSLEFCNFSSLPSAAEYEDLVLENLQKKEGVDPFVYSAQVKPGQQTCEQIYGGAEWGNAGSAILNAAGAAIVTSGTAAITGLAEGSTAGLATPLGIALVGAAAGSDAANARDAVSKTKNLMEEHKIVALMKEAELGSGIDLDQFVSSVQAGHSNLSRADIINALKLEDRSARDCHYNILASSDALEDQMKIEISTTLSNKSEKANLSSAEKAMNISGTAL